ncbi:MAG: type 1 glutamine amidotransferase, partial [Pseudomonadota bacterium]
VTELPDDARPIGTNDFCRYPALAYGDHILTLQPHPEITPAYMRGLIEVRGPGIVPDARLAAAASKIDAPLDAEAVADHIARFFQAAKVKADA